MVRLSKSLDVKRPDNVSRVEGVKPKTPQKLRVFKSTVIRYHINNSDVGSVNLAAYSPLVLLICFDSDVFSCERPQITFHHVSVCFTRGTFFSLFQAKAASLL